jgi:hypothetical protein
MPKYLVQKHYDWVSGTGDRGMETPPPDVLDERGVIIRPLARWPQGPLELEVENEDEAIERASHRWLTEGRTIYIDSRIKPERFHELMARERPGSEGRFTSINGCWVGKRADDPGDAWYYWASETFTPKASG